MSDTDFTPSPEERRLYLEFAVESMRAGMTFREAFQIADYAFRSKREVRQKQEPEFSSEEQLIELLVAAYVYARSELYYALTPQEQREYWLHYDLLGDIAEMTDGLDQDVRYTTPELEAIGLVAAALQGEFRLI